MADYRNQTDLPRGIRNNNPGNIKAGEAWQGAAGDDGVFVIFADTVWGIRAMAKALANMQGRGLNTIQSLINAWAPPSENITSAYVNSVSNDTGIPPTAVLGTDPDTQAALIRAIVNHENGDVNSATYISDDDIYNGIDKANSGILSVIPAAAVAAQENPASAAALLIGATAILILLSRK